MSNKYVWNSSPFYQDFFKGKYKDYEESAYLTPEQLEKFKRCFIWGNTLAVREILKLVDNKGGYRVEIILDSYEEQLGEADFMISYDEETNMIISQNQDNDLDENIYYQFEPTIENIEGYITEQVLQANNVSLYTIQTINKIEGDIERVVMNDQGEVIYIPVGPQRVGNLYTQSQNCYSPIDKWKKTLPKVKKINRNRVFLSDYFPPNVAAQIAEQSVGFGKRSKRNSKLRSVETDIRYLSSKD